jgi:UDP-N-acetylmuramate dehydrogenase
VSKVLEKIEHAENVDLKNFCTIKIGGKGKKIYFPKSIEQIQTLIKESNEKNKPIFPLGIGSNVIFKDGIVDRIFIHSKNLKKINYWFDREFFYINAESGVSFKTIVNLIKKYNLEGFENLSGIPASIGGAVAMNAGAFGSEIFDLVEKVIWIDEKGNIIESKKKEIDFSYRYTQFQEGCFVYSAVLKLKKSNKNIPEIVKNHLLERNKKQPLDKPTSGSTFKNSEKFSAGFLLEKSGFKGKRINEIGFSEKHANFLINYGNASFKDLIRLLETAEKNVLTNFNIKLEREIKIVE